MYAATTQEKLLECAEEMAVLAGKVSKVRELHKSYTVMYANKSSEAAKETEFCNECNTVFPCNTIRTLDPALYMAEPEVNWSLS